MVYLSYHEEPINKDEDDISDEQSEFTPGPFIQLSPSTSPQNAKESNLLIYYNTSSYHLIQPHIH